jgi:hypothetical protein
MISETLTPASDLRSWSDAPPQDSLQITTSVEFFILVENMGEKIRKYASAEVVPALCNRELFLLTSVLTAFWRRRIATNARRLHEGT